MSPMKHQDKLYVLPLFAMNNVPNIFEDHLKHQPDCLQFLLSAVFCHALVYAYLGVRLVYKFGLGILTNSPCFLHCKKRVCSCWYYEWNGEDAESF